MDSTGYGEETGGSSHLSWEDRHTEQPERAASMVYAVGAERAAPAPESPAKSSGHQCSMRRCRRGVRSAAGLDYTDSLDNDRLVRLVALAGGHVGYRVRYVLPRLHPSEYGVGAV